MSSPIVVSLATSATPATPASISLGISLMPSEVLMMLVLLPLRTSGQGVTVPAMLTFCASTLVMGPSTSAVGATVAMTVGVTVAFIAGPLVHPLSSVTAVIIATTAIAMYPLFIYSPP
ncbi:hypothetical protein RCIX230 [Methanocella arvoryzae MRE50]|uniref:Uncharacterized protein n=1 Tax=Methanocella arvoryzae (strain DSM 22066 / NBRC 105507 / MRE50) TaxID=351160 RepID=Q0W7D9_METAR|nr:hypothetical protein RCIX230 [Methanocella arvoryzae MRE50]